MIGYWLLQAMQNALPGRHVASMINQTLVLAGDPALTDPTKFIGEVYSKDQAQTLAAQYGWTVKPDGDYYRRVIGSPTPQRVIETRLIRTLLQTGAIVICAGGGGIPVIRNHTGKLQGIEAVIDKDLTAAVLAEHLEADALLILTDTNGVYTDYNTPQQQHISRATPTTLRKLNLPSGSMGPKVEAACRFVELTGDTAAIGPLHHAADILNGTTGTIITPTGTYPHNTQSSPEPVDDRLKRA
jgi:carbamate kinase